MGIKELPEYKDYSNCATVPILHDPFVSGKMTLKRFEKLSQYIHCSTALLWPVPDDPGRRTVVLEAVHGQETRETGLKLWFLCDSDTGYCVAFNVYCGSTRDNQQANLDLGYRVAMGLMPNYLNYIVCLNNCLYDIYTWTSWLLTMVLTIQMITPTRPVVGTAGYQDQCTTVYVVYGYRVSTIRPRSGKSSCFC